MRQDGVAAGVVVANWCLHQALLRSFPASARKQ